MSNPFTQEDYNFAVSKEYQQQTATYQEQTAGDSQYQDQPPTYRGGGMSNNPFSPPPASAPPPPPLSSDSSDAGSINPTDSGDDASSGISGFLAYPTPPSARRGGGDPLSSPTTTPTRYPSSTGSHSSNTYSGYYSSYQNARAAPVPMITNYGVSPAQTFYPQGTSSYGESPSVSPSKMGFRGNVNLRPNTGQTNDEYGGIGSLREVTSRLRWMTIACTLAALIWEGFAFPSRVFLYSWDHAAKVVLGGYLAFFSFLLLGVELNAPLRDNFGVLYHPLGRGFLLFFMSGMSFGFHIDWWELVLCVAFFACSFGYIYAYIKYPEYRRWQDYNDNQVWADVRSAMRQTAATTADWADPLSQRTASHILSGAAPLSWTETQRETQSLLHQV